MGSAGLAARRRFHSRMVAGPSAGGFVSGSDPYQGIHAVLYAFFQTDESLDLDAMARQVEYCISGRCNGITVLGLATEVAKLSFAERKAVVECVAQANRGRLPLSVTLAGNSVAEQVELGAFAQDKGADWLILQPPLAGSYSPDIYLDFFERVAGEVGLPVAIQNAPQYLGRALSAADIVRLRRCCANLKCVKCEDTALGIRRMVEAAGADLHILGGRGGLEITDCLRAGCRGFVLAPDIAFLAVQVYAAWQDGHEQQAERLYAEAAPAITFVMQSLEHLVTYGKRIFAIHAGLEVHDRMPCLRPTPFGLQLAAGWAARLTEITAAAAPHETS